MANRILRKFLIVLSICAGALLLLFIAFSLMIEYGGKWSEKKRQQFAEECAKTTTVEGLNFSLVGFKPGEIDSVLFIQLQNGNAIDSFYVYPDIKNDNRHKGQHWMYLDKTIHITDTYHIVVPNVQTFVLSDMEMVMWPQYTMMSEGWGCRMGNYTIDGVRFEHDSSPALVKEGFIWP